MSTRNWKRARRFAVIFSIIAGLLLIGLISQPSLATQDRTIAFLVLAGVAAIDWVRVIKHRPQKPKY